MEEREVFDKKRLEFLKIRDTEELFEPVRERNGIGIPLFVREDGAKTFDITKTSPVPWPVWEGFCSLNTVNHSVAIA